MSLMVYLCPKNPSSDISGIEKKFETDNNSLFGLENWRKSVWGSDEVKNMGCQILHTLKDNDIYAFDNNIGILKADLYLILKNISSISDNNTIIKESIEIRINNALEVIRVAEMYLDKVGVYIG